jgi:hypothetical protein
MGSNYPEDSSGWPPRNNPQQSPQYGQQWQPQQYSPGAHQRRLDDGVPPQGYPSQRPGWQQPPPQYPPPGPPRHPAPRRRKRSKARTIAWAVIGSFFGIIVIIIAVSAATSPQAPPAATGAPLATSAPPQPTTAAVAATVTYVVTGSTADVTYGPAGSDATGSVPMRKTVTIPASAPLYYSISAQLQGSGTVSCEILVGGTVVSKSTASGGYNIAQCEISQDPLSGKWTDTNGG